MSEVLSSQLRQLGKSVEFLRLLWGLDQSLQSLSKRMDGAIGVTGPQRLALRVVDSLPNLSAGALAEILRLHPSTVTGIIARLSRKGLLRQQRDPSDGRRVLIALTPRGKRLCEEGPGTIEFAVQRTLRASRPAELAAARAVLERLTRAIEREAEAEAMRRLG